MGGTTFDTYAAGADVKDAYNRAVDSAVYEYGHGAYSGTIKEKDGYVVITHTPMGEREARELAYRLINEDDPRITDKWGPAGAIPVISDTRTVTLSDFEYWHSFYASTDDALTEKVTELLKAQRGLKRGETIQSVWLTTYRQPKPPNMLSGARPSAELRSECTAQVTIAKPPTTRKTTVKVTVPGGLDWQQEEKELRAAAEGAVRLKQGERVIGIRSLSKTPGKPKVTVVAPKGKTVTRYVVTNTDHASWSNGFPTQAAARKFATDHAGRVAQRDLRDREVLEVMAVTRREDGSPLVHVTREIPSYAFEVEVEVSFATRTAEKPDGWLFFGWASC